MGVGSSARRKRVLIPVVTIIGLVVAEFCQRPNEPPGAVIWDED
jgi:hypothetical protein